jgi:hypothetical protein
MSPQRTGSTSVLRRLTLTASIVRGRVRAVLAASAIAAVSALAPVAAAPPAAAAGLIAASDPAIVAQGTLLHLFVRGADGMLWYSPWTGGGQAPFQSLGGPVQGGPAAASLGPGHLDVFVRGMNNALYHKVFTSGRWSGWGRIAEDVTSDPAVVTPDRSRMDLFVRGRDGALYHRQWNPQTDWQSWQSLGGPVQGGPAAASLGPGHLDVFVRGANNALIHKFFASGRWSGWSQLGNDLTADPAATSNTSWTSPGNQMRLFARGGDGALYERGWSRQTQWTPWESAGYRPNGGPDAAEAGTLIVVVRGADNALYYRAGFGSTSTWKKWPGSGP